MAFREGFAEPNSGSNKPSRVITESARPGRLVGPAPTMATDSADGVVTKPKRHTSQGWTPNPDVRQVES